MSLETSSTIEDNIKFKEGSLYVLSSDGKSWKKRFCTFKNRILFIFENKSKSDSTSPNYQILYFIPLARCGLISTAITGGPNGRSFCFKLSHEIDESILYWLADETEESMKEWVRILQLSCSIQKEPERVQVRGRSKSVAFKPGALEIAGISSDYKGWLKKYTQTGTFRKTIQWKKRWFVLKDLVLYFYEGPESNNELKGKISIPNWSVEIDTQTPVGYCFTLSHPGYSTITLQAETEEERTKWIKNIKDNNKMLTKSFATTSEIKQLSLWFKQLTGLEVKEPLDLVCNASFIINILDKVGFHVQLIERDHKSQRNTDDEWTTSSFDTIIKALTFKGIQFDQQVSPDDFIKNDPVVLTWAISIMNHFNPQSKTTTTTTTTSATSTTTVEITQPSANTSTTPVIIVDGDQIQKSDSNSSIANSSPQTTPRSMISDISSVTTDHVDNGTTTTTTATTPATTTTKTNPILQIANKITSSKSHSFDSTKLAKKDKKDKKDKTSEKDTSSTTTTTSKTTPSTPSIPSTVAPIIIEETKPIETKPIELPPTPKKELPPTPIKSTTTPPLPPLPQLPTSTTTTPVKPIAIPKSSHDEDLDIMSSLDFDFNGNQTNNTSKLNLTLDDIEEDDDNGENSIIQDPFNESTNNNNNIITPISTPTKSTSNVSPRYVVSPFRNLKRVETHDVLGEFDKIFSSLSKAVKNCQVCSEPIASDPIEIKSGKSWHRHHFQCNVCQKPIYGIDAELPYIERDDNIYCKDDHDKKYKESNCSECNKSLMITFAYKGNLLCREHYLNYVGDQICQQCETPIGNAPYQTFENKKWHIDHFKCSYCNKSLPDPQVAKFKNNKPYCSKCSLILH